MLKKLGLDQTKKYESALATNKVAHMLAAYISGREHYISIGSEQGIEKWDDFIIEVSPNQFEHIQAKRQMTPFSKEKDNPTRDAYTQNDRKGKLRDLSPLDKSMQSLADFFAAPRIPGSVKRTFKLVVPSLDILIKNNLTLRHLHSFCVTHLNPLTTSAGMAALEAGASDMKNLFEWLRTWCGFQSHDHIIRALLNFGVFQSGNENDIEEDTIKVLESYFVQPDQVLKEIRTHIDSNSSFTSAITPRSLLLHVQSRLLPSTVSWTQFKKDGGNWEISGIHDRNINSIENAVSVVPALWSPGGAGILKYHSNHDSVGPLSQAITRLVLHFQPAALAHIKDANLWTIAVRGVIGNTLGLSENDCENLSVIDDNACFSSSNSRVLPMLADHDGEATSLSIEMHNKSWALVCSSLMDRIAKMVASELRNAVDERWKDWKAKLDDDVDQQRALCESMLHPKAEGEDIIAELRVGPKTVHLIAQGIFLLLAVAVCLSEPGGGWTTIDGQLTIDTKALAYWSGPSGKPRQVRKITDEGISSLLGKESAKIILLSNVESAPSEILGLSLAEDRDFAASMASSHEPVVLITNSPTMSRYIKNGNIEEMKIYLLSRIQKGRKARLLNE